MAPSTALVMLCFQFLIAGCYSTSLTVVNKCSYTVWPAILSGGGTLPLPTTGFTLQAGESAMVEVPTGWYGRIFGRTLCSQDSNGVFSCVTGDCGSSTVQCPGGNNPALPATFAEFVLNGGFGGMDMIDLSVADGYKIAMMVEPQGAITGAGNCVAVACVIDLNTQCPSELKVISDGKAVGCKSACQAFGDPQSCCTGAYTAPHTCKPSAYAPFFKNSCPQATTSPYDQTMAFSCFSADNYLVMFCPSSSTSSIELSTNGEYPSKKANWEASLHSILKDMEIVLSSIVALVSIVYDIYILLKRRGSGHQFADSYIQLIRSGKANINGCNTTWEVVAPIYSVALK